MNDEEKTPLQLLNLTVRSEHLLKRGRVYDIETLQSMDPKDILAIPGFGKKSLSEIMEALLVYENTKERKVMAKKRQAAESWIKPVAWIKIRELSYMKAVAEHGKHDWQTNLGLKPEPDDEGLYTETQVQRMIELLERCENEMRYAGWTKYESDNTARNGVYEQVKEFLK